MKRQYEYLHKNFFGIGAALFCFLLLLFFFRLFPAGAQTTDPNRDELEPRIQTFFNALVKGDTVLAFDGLLRDSPLNFPDASEHVRSVRAKVEELQTDFGAILAAEKIETKRINANIALVRYVSMYEHYPVIWTFTFYRKPSQLSPSSPTSTPWVLVELHFDMDMKSLL